MGFLNRKKSNVSTASASPARNASRAPPLPAAHSPARGQQTTPIHARLQTVNGVGNGLEMPDLRFSQLDLGSGVMSAAGQQTQRPMEKRRSKNNLLTGGAQQAEPSYVLTNDLARSGWVKAPATNARGGYFERAEQAKQPQPHATKPLPPPRAQARKSDSAAQPPPPPPPMEKRQVKPKSPQPSMPHSHSTAAHLHGDDSHSERPTTKASKPSSASATPPLEAIRFTNPHPVAAGKSLQRPFITTTPSEGGNTTASTSTADGKRRSSIDTSGSGEGEASSLGESDELFADAHTGAVSPSAARQHRPARDEEREQRRVSMTLDGETAAAVDVALSVAPAAAAAAAAAATPAQKPHVRNGSDTSTFSAMLRASRPGGAADRSVEQEERKAEEQARQAAYRAGQQQSMLVRSGLVKPADSAVAVLAAEEAELQQRMAARNEVLTTPQRRQRERMPVVSPSKRVVQPELRVEGNGWSCMGVGDPTTVDSHWHTVVETMRVAIEDGEKVEYEDREVETHYNDLFEMLFTATTPDVITRVLSHMEMADVKALRQTSSSVRLAVGANRELILSQFLAPIGYKTWTYVRGSANAYRSRAAQVKAASQQCSTDPCPLLLTDVEAFLIGQELLPEYAIVGQEYSRSPGAIDPAIARLARATTRAHNRVLTRLRLQPSYKPAAAASVANGSPSRKTSNRPGSSSASSAPATPPSSYGRQPSSAASRHNSYYDLRGRAAGISVSDLPPSPSSHQMMTAPATPLSCRSAPFESTEPATPPLVSPWKPGRAAQYRVWVPAKDPSGWLSDDELAEMEQQLYQSGIWSHMKRGDIVWDTAVGDKMNEGKYVFDGQYVRDLSYAYDVSGHLPSWLNVVMFSPSYWHNVLRSSMSQPVVYLDILPWREQILTSLRLVQDHVDMYSGHGARYRIAKWLYRSSANVTHGQIISRMNGGLEIVDEAWHGRIVIETEGTAESAKLLVSRCAGPEATLQEKAALLASVMGDAGAANKMLNTHDTNGLARGVGGGMQKPVPRMPATTTTMMRRKEALCAPWAIMRERSRPGLIWLRPLSERETVGGM